MIRLRPYKECDAETILSWCEDEISFYKWTADKYNKYPITVSDMNKKYFCDNCDCAESDNFYPFTAFDETGIVGHMIMRFLDKEKRTLRFGFVIVDSSKRGKGYGKEIMSLALKYAFEIFKAEKVTICVFDNNPGAYNCYKKLGFIESKNSEPEYYSILGEKWKYIELEKNL